MRQRSVRRFPHDNDNELAILDLIFPSIVWLAVRSEAQAGLLFGDSWHIGCSQLLEGGLTSIGEPDWFKTNHEFRKNIEQAR